MDNGSKTEKATSKKRQDERKKGHVSVSKDLAMVLSLLLVFVVVKITFPTIYKEISGMLFHYINSIATKTAVSVNGGHEIFMDCARIVLVTTGPIFAAAIAAAVIGTGAQTRFLFSMDSVKPKFSKLNPISGIKNLMSMRSLVEILKNLMKLGLLIYVLYRFFLDRVNDMTRMLFIGLPQSTAYLLDCVMSMVYMISLIFLFLGGFDFFYQRWDFEKQMRMSKQEVKEEYKQLEGDPQIKGKIKEQQRKMAMSRMMQAVPTADVIIRNPTHFAVALKYDMDKDRAPYVVAKGQDELALRIVKVGEENGVFIMENPPLARAIYAASDVRSEIPLEYYGAVAEIMALVYKLKKKKTDMN